MKNFMSRLTRKKAPEFPPIDECDNDTITRELELVPYFVYSNDKNEIIGSIYLTEEQSYQLNQLMKHSGHQDIAFLRK